MLQMSDVPGDLIPTLPAAGTGRPPRRRTLLIMRGDEVEVRTLPLQGEVTIGRGSQSDVRIEHPSISRAHLRIALTDRALRVTDLDSANGTTLRGARLPANVTVEISANDALVAGEVVLVIQEVQGGTAAAPA